MLTFYFEGFLFVVVLISVFLIIIYSLRVGISPVPSTKAVQEIVLDAIPSTQKGEIFELGSGWGSLLFPLAEHCQDAVVTGIEISPVPLLFTKIRQFFHSSQNIIIKRENFYNISLNNATIVVCYLFPRAMRELKEKFERELQSGTMVVSNTFAIPHWKPYAVIELQDLYHTKIYIYYVNFNDF